MVLISGSELVCRQLTLASSSWAKIVVIHSYMESLARSYRWLDSLLCKDIGSLAASIQKSR